MKTTTPIQETLKELKQRFHITKTHFSDKGISYDYETLEADPKDVVSFIDDLLQRKERETITAIENVIWDKLSQPMASIVVGIIRDMDSLLNLNKE